MTPEQSKALHDWGHWFLAGAVILLALTLAALALAVALLRPGEEAFTAGLALVALLGVGVFALYPPLREDRP